MFSLDALDNKSQSFAVSITQTNESPVVKSSQTNNDPDVCEDTTENHLRNEKTEKISLAEYFSLIQPTITQQELQSDSGLDTDKGKFVF